MHFLLPLTLLCTAGVTAQNEFEIYPDDGGAGTTFISRGSFGTGQGAMFQDYTPSHFRGIGDDGTQCAIAAVQYIFQDEDTATQDPYDFVIRTGSAAGPDLGTAAVIVGGTLTSPLGAGGPGAWQITLTLGGAPVPCDDHYFVGYQFPADPDWPTTDGLAPWVYLYSQDSGISSLAPHHAWQFIGDPDTGTVNQPSRRVVQFALRVDPPTLNIGADTTTGPFSPDFGPAGMYPNVDSLGTGGADHGLVFRIRDGSNPNGNATLLFGTGYDAPFSLGLFGVPGNLYINLSLVGQLTSTSLDATGTAIIALPWLAQGEIHRFAGAGLLTFQALTSTGIANIRATNGAGTIL